MMNYTKSEFYRVFITKEIYIAAALMTGIVLLLNGALHFFGGSYANTSSPILIWWQVLWPLLLWE